MPPHRRLVGACLIVVAVLTSAAAVISGRMQTGQTGLAIAGALPVLVEVATAAIGVWLVYLFWPRRQGWGLHCKRCGYYQERQGRLTAACPECGATWLWIGATRSGRPSGAAMLVALGLALCGLSLVGAVTPSAAPWVYLRLLPERVILEQIAVLPDDATAGLWAELKRRKVPQATLDALAKPLLRKKARDGYLSLAAESVVFDAMMRPGAPQDLSAQYFGSFLSAQVEDPASVEAGRVIAHNSVAVFRGRTLTTGAPPRVVVVSALYREGETEPLTTWQWELSPEAAAIQERRMDFSWEAGEPGTVRLRQAFWLAIGTPGAERITWSGGQPVLPRTLAFKDQFDESRQVRVLPKQASPSSQPR